MQALDSRRLFTFVTVLALALCVPLLAMAQENPQSSTGQSTSSDANKGHADVHKGQSADKASDQAGMQSAAGGQADHRFVMKAAEGGMMEVELGQLAASKAKNDDVKQLGQKMVDDHSKANEELKSLAQQKGITLPTEPSAKAKQKKARLEKLSGDAFDRAYVQEMMKDHSKDIAEFEKEAKSGKDPEIKAWAEKTLPTLHQHRDQVQSESAKLGISKKEGVAAEQ